ncbi:MAG: glycosyltransferase family 4 protein [Acidobacteriota bacterium]
MRVALVVPGFSASEEDWCIPSLWDMVRALSEQADLRIFSLRYPHHRRPYSLHGATVFPFGGAQRRRLHRLPLLTRALATILRQARHRSFDVLHALWAHEPGFLAVLAGRLTRTPVVVSLRGGELADLPEIGYGGQCSTTNRWLIERALGGADRVTVGSRYLKELAADRWDSSRWSILSPGVDCQRFHADPPARISYRATSPERGQASDPALEGNPKLLHVASLSPVKNQGLLLRAFAIVACQRPDARLHIVGDGVLLGELQELAEELGIRAGVRFHGQLPHHQLPDLYRQADLCVITSRFESACMVALEAAACGCPTVGTAVGVLPELGASARTVASRDPHALGSLLVDTLGNDQTLAAMREAGLQLIRSSYTLEHTSRQLMNIYEELARISQRVV